MPANTYSNLAAKATLTLVGLDCMINGDVGAGAVIHIKGGSLTINGRVGDDVEIIVGAEMAGDFKTAWQNFLQAGDADDTASRQLRARTVRRHFNAVADKGVSINGAVGNNVHIASAGDVRLRGGVGDGAHIVAGGGLYSPKAGHRAALAAGRDIMVDQVGDAAHVFAGQRACVTFLGARSLITAQQIVGARASTLPFHCPQKSRDVHTGARMTYLYNGIGLARLKR